MPLARKIETGNCHRITLGVRLTTTSILGWVPWLHDAHHKSELQQKPLSSFNSGCRRELLECGPHTFFVRSVSLLPPPFFPPHLLLGIHFPVDHTSMGSGRHQYGPLVTGQCFAGASIASVLMQPRNMVSLGASGAVFGMFAVSVLTKLQFKFRKLLEFGILGQFVLQQVLNVSSISLSNESIVRHSIVALDQICI